MTGQVGHARPAVPPPVASAVVPGIAVLLAAVLLVGIALAAFQSDTASAATRLVEGDGVTATLEDGSSTGLSVGDEVPDGATVAAPDGAVLRTRGRDVLVGPQARVTVVDGARQVLEDGFVMVDAREGPALDVETAAAVVTTPGGAVARIEPGAVLRVGGFAGDPVRVRAVGRQATAEVEALHQVQVPIGGLPARVTPLTLTGDPYEHRVAPDLLAADRALTDLGRTLDSAGDQGPVVLTALRTALPAMAPADLALRPASTGAPSGPATPRSEPALAFLLAAAPLTDAGQGDAGALALPAGDPRLAERYAEARDLRAAGGSWGVVAGLVDAPVSAVGGLLDQLLSPLVLAVGDAPSADLVSLLTPPTAAPPASGGTGGSTGDGSAPPSGGTGPTPPPPGGPPSEPPPPGPGLPPPPPPPGDPQETVEEIVETVIGLLPDPPTAPAPAPGSSPAPLPEPAPAPKLSLLDRLLDPLLPD